MKEQLREVGALPPPTKLQSTLEQKRATQQQSDAIAQALLEIEADEKVIQILKAQLEGMEVRFISILGTKIETIQNSVDDRKFGIALTRVLLAQNNSKAEATAWIEEHLQMPSAPSASSIITNE